VTAAQRGQDRLALVRSRIPASSGLIRRLVFDSQVECPAGVILAADRGANKVLVDAQDVLGEASRSLNTSQTC